MLIDMLKEGTITKLKSIVIAAEMIKAMLLKIPISFKFVIICLLPYDYIVMHPACQMKSLGNFDFKGEKCVELLDGVKNLNTLDRKPPKNGVLGGVGREELNTVLRSVMLT